MTVGLGSPGDHAAAGHLAPLRPDELSEPQRALYESIISTRAELAGAGVLTGAHGQLLGPFDLMLRAPGVGMVLERLGTAVRQDTALSLREREVAILCVARDTRSPFEWHAHAATSIASGALDAFEIEQFREDDTAPADCRTLVTYVRHVLSGRSLSAAEQTSVNERYGVREQVELVVLVGLYRTLADLMRVFHVGVPAGGTDPFAAQPDVSGTPGERVGDDACHRPGR